MHCELTSSEASALSMLEAANGKFAKPFDLFIVDYDTPAGGGFKYIEAMRNIKRLLKCQAYNAFTNDASSLFDRLNKHGIDMGIGKPIIPSILLNGILDIFNLKAVSAVGLQRT